MTDDRSYEVGYGRPPKKNQWKKGQSGNPNGRAGYRRKQMVAVDVRLRRAVQQMIPVTRDGKPTRAPFSEVLIESIFIDALQAPLPQKLKVFKELIALGVMSPGQEDFETRHEAVDRLIERLAEEARKSGMYD